MFLEAPQGPVMAQRGRRRGSRIVKAGSPDTVQSDPAQSELARSASRMARFVNAQILRRRNFRSSAPAIAMIAQAP
jgi:hypothetical protein